MRNRLPFREGLIDGGKIEEKPPIDNEVKLITKSLANYAVDWQFFFLGQCYVSYSLRFSIPQCYVNETKEDAHFLTLLLPEPIFLHVAPEWDNRIQGVDGEHANDFFMFLRCHYVWAAQKGLFGRFNSRPINLVMAGKQFVVEVFFPVSNRETFLPVKLKNSVVFSKQSPHPELLKRQAEILGEKDGRKVWRT